jgi:hypothetical protein
VFLAYAPWMVQAFLGGAIPGRVLLAALVAVGFAVYNSR